MGAADAKVDAVVRNWFPRFVANDVDYLDLQRLLEAIETWDDWPDEWEALADRYAALADAAEDAGHLVTAGEHLRRAALLLQFGQFVLTEDVERRTAMHRRQCALFRRAAPWLTPPAEPFHLEVGDTEVFGYLRLPTAPAPTGAGHAVVIQIPGLESTKEQFSTFEPYFLARGMATLSMEGPGQGEGWYAQPFSMDSYVTAFHAVCDWLAARPAIDPARIGVMGTSFGGHLSLRCVAERPGLAGLVSFAGPYEVDLSSLQPVLQDGFVHLSGAADLADASRRLADVTLAGHLERIDTEVLLVHGDADNVIGVEHGDRIAAEMGDRITYDRVAGGNHSCQNLHTVVRPRVADWLAERLLPRT